MVELIYEVNFITLAKPDAQYRNRNHLAVSQGGQSTYDRGDARNSERDPKDRETYQCGETCPPLLPPRLESRRAMGRFLQPPARRNPSRAGHNADSIQGTTGVDRAAHAVTSR